MNDIDELRNEVRELINKHNKNHSIMIAYEGSDLMRDNLNTIQTKLKKVEAIERIVILKHNCTKQIKHVCAMMEDNAKYVFSEACTENMNLYFKWVNEYIELEKSL